MGCSVRGMVYEPGFTLKKELKARSVVVRFGESNTTKSSICGFFKSTMAVNFMVQIYEIKTKYANFTRGSRCGVCEAKLR